MLNADLPQPDIEAYILFYASGLPSDRCSHPEIEHLPTLFRITECSLLFILSLVLEYFF